MIAASIENISIHVKSDEMDVIELTVGLYSELMSGEVTAFLTEQERTTFLAWLADVEERICRDLGGS
jgi:hypothetical protein